MRVAHLQERHSDAVTKRRAAGRTALPKACEISLPKAFMRIWTSETKRWGRIPEVLESERTAYSHIITSVERKHLKMSKISLSS